MKRKWQDKNYRDKAINGMSKVRRASTNPASRAAVSQKISEAMKRKWQDQNYRALMTNNNKSSTSNGTRSPKRKTVRRTTSNTSAKRNMEKTEQSSQPIKESTVPQDVTIMEDVIIPHTTAKSLGIDIQEDQRRVTKLRQERRDLYEFLYGDDDDDDDLNGREINGFDDIGNDDDKQVKLEDFW